MSARVPAKLAAIVRERADHRCEYCLMPQASQSATFHFDHVQPRADGGRTESANLALACVICSLKKAARTHAKDPESAKIVRLFHPRLQNWADHFEWGPDWNVVGKTATGRATVDAFGMNRPDIVFIRRGLAELGRLP